MREIIPAFFLPFCTLPILMLRRFYQEGNSLFLTKEITKNVGGGICLQLSMEKIGQTLLVKVSGELDLSTSPLFRELIETELEKDNFLRYLVLDMNDTSFIDSSGLGAILGRFKKITQKGGKLSFIRVPAHLSKLFELSGLMRIMEIHPSLEAALDKQ